MSVIRDLFQHIRECGGTLGRFGWRNRFELSQRFRFEIQPWALTRNEAISLPMLISGNHSANKVRTFERRDDAASWLLAN